jgi:hypothetical protein
MAGASPRSSGICGCQFGKNREKVKSNEDQFPQHATWVRMILISSTVKQVTAKLTQNSWKRQQKDGEQSLPLDHQKNIRSHFGQSTPKPSVTSNVEVRSGMSVLSHGRRKSKQVTYFLWAFLDLICNRVPNLIPRRP